MSFHMCGSLLLVVTVCIYTERHQSAYSPLTDYCTALFCCATPFSMRTSHRLQRFHCTTSFATSTVPRLLYARASTACSPCDAVPHVLCDTVSHTRLYYHACSSCYTVCLLTVTVRHMRMHLPVYIPHLHGLCTSMVTAPTQPTFLSDAANVHLQTCCNKILVLLQCAVSGVRLELYN